MSNQEQYHIFKKALFGVLSEKEEAELKEARKNPNVDAAFNEYLETSYAILQVEENANTGQEYELAYQYVQKTTTPGETLYVEYRIHYDEEYAQLVTRARELISEQPGEETTIGHPAVASNAEDTPQQEQQTQPETLQIPQELPGNTLQTTVTVRRLIPRKTSWYTGVAAAVLIAVLAGWFVNRGGTILGPEEDRLVEQIWNINPDDLASGGGSFGNVDEMDEEIQQLLSKKEYALAEERLDYLYSQKFNLDDKALSTFLRYEIIAIVNQGLDDPARRNRALSLLDRRLEIYLKRSRNYSKVNIAKEKNATAFKRVLILSYDDELRAEQLNKLESLLAQEELLNAQIFEQAKILREILRKE